MSGRIPLGFPILAGALVLFSASRAEAVAPVIRDGGGFFSGEAVKKANEQIRELYRKYGRDLLVETFATVPDDMGEKVKNMSREERDRFFEKWAKERSEAHVVHGIYILATKEPARLQIEISPRFRSVVDDQANKRLTNMLLNDFREKNFDAGLDDVIKFMRMKLQEQSPNR